MMKRIATTVMFIAFAFPALAETPPDQIARDVTTKIIGLIKANRDAYAKDYRKLYQMVDQNILPHYDFRRVSQQVLGPAWRNATPEQRDKFTKEFRDLMVRTYGTALLKYTDEEIVYLPLKLPPGDKVAVVRSQIRRGGGAPPIAINYKFYKPANEWKVYDMEIEGPSIVTTYQRVYAERLQKQNLDQLISAMAQENQRAAAGGAVNNAGAGK